MANVVVNGDMLGDKHRLSLAMLEIISIVQPSHIISGICLSCGCHSETRTRTDAHLQHINVTGLDTVPLRVGGVGSGWVGLV